MSALIVGTTRREYVLEAVKALDVSLSDENTQFLEETYTPHSIAAMLIGQ